MSSRKSYQKIPDCSWTSVIIIYRLPISEHVDIQLRHETSYYTEEMPEWVKRLIEAAKTDGLDIKIIKHNQKEIDYV